MIEDTINWDEFIPKLESKELVKPELDIEGHLHGVTPITYRVCFEFDPPLTSHKKGSRGQSKEINRAEFFVNDERMFFFLSAALGRVTKITKAVATILDDESQLVWRDKSPADEDTDMGTEVLPY